MNQPLSNVSKTKSAHAGLDKIEKKWVVHYNPTYVSNGLTIDEFLFGQQSRAVLVGGVDDFLYFLTCDIYAVRRVNAVDFFDRQPSIPVLISLAERFCQLLALMAIVNTLLVEQHYTRHAQADLSANVF